MLPATNEQRVLALLPNSADGERTATFLAAVGIVCVPCRDVLEVVRLVQEGAGALLLAEESLLRDTSGFLRGALDEQPSWSALPLIVLAREAADPRLDRLLSGVLANVTLVERPVRQRTLISVVRAALRARRHQYQIRDALRERERQALLLAEKDDRLRFALTAANLGSWELDLASGAFEYSEIFRAHLGSVAGEVLTPQELLGTVHPEDVARVREEVRRAIRGGGEHRIEFRTVWPDGQVHWIEVRGQASGDDKHTTTRLVGISFDVTEQRRATAELARQAAQLREADKRKDEFLATLAHELRNPLAPVRTGLEVLRRVPNTDAAERARAMMDRQVGHMVRLIDDLLDVSRITLGKVGLTKERLTVQSIIEAGLETSGPAIEAARHRLLVDVAREPIWVEGDRTRLAQVVGNLLNNACKYTPPGGRIEISARREGDDAVIQVRDTGIGIPPDKLTEAFELFSQLNRTLDRSQGGLGIGLALVQRLVQMHGGSIDAHSEGSGKGTAFTVRLPAVAAIATAARAGVPEARHPDQAQRILVVDDNHDAADSLSMLLETLGHETRTVHSGFEAVAAAVEFQPSLVFLDIGLPGISGYEVARRLKSDDALATTMIVAVTGWGTEEDRRRAAEAGFDVHLTKPIDIAAVQNVLVRSTSDR